jgi:hypothetical protein
LRDLYNCLLKLVLLQYLKKLPDLTIATIATEILTLSAELTRRLKNARKENVWRAPQPKIMRKLFTLFTKQLKRLLKSIMISGNKKINHIIKYLLNAIKYVVSMNVAVFRLSPKKGTGPQICFFFFSFLDYYFILLGIEEFFWLKTLIMHFFLFRSN